jgi:cytochrome P450
MIALQRAGYMVGDRPMTEWDLIGHFAMLVAAGYETATGIANAILFADTFGLLDQLYADPMLVPGWGEETWRYYPPFPAARRRVVAATTLGGQHLKVGTWVLGWLTAANRSPVQFPRPDRYDIRRSPNRHLAFGRGRRSCLGAGLARLEMTIALQVLLERLRGLRRDRGESLVRTFGIVDSLERLPCSFAAPAQRP